MRVVADADCSKAALLNPLVAAGITVSSRVRQDAVGWDEPAPVVGKRPRGRPRQQGWPWKLATRRRTAPARTVTVYGKAETVQVVWRDVWRRDVTHQVRVVAIATTREPILWVSTDLTLLPAVLIQLYAARFPLELTRRDLQQYGGLGDYQWWTWLARPRFVQLALIACCLGRLTLLQDQQAPWLTAERFTLAGELSPLSVQRLHRAWRRFVLGRIFAHSAPGADAQTTEVSYQQIFRIAA